MNLAPSIDPSVKTAFLFPGQGAQCVGMGQTLYEKSPLVRQIFDETTCSFDIKKLCFEGPVDKLRETRYSQACIFLASIAIAKLLFEKGLEPNAVAGISLGEYTALCFAKSFTIQDAVNMLVDRGQIMADCIPINTGMFVVLGLDKDVIAECCIQASAIGDCEIASYITNDRIVITGDIEAIRKCADLCKQRGAKAALAIEASGAFHSKLAINAASKFKDALEPYSIAEPTIPIYYNFDGSTNCEDIKSTLVGQLYKPVQFFNTINNMLDDGYSQFISIGPGTALEGFVQAIARIRDAKIHTHNVDSYDDVLKVSAATGNIR